MFTLKFNVSWTIKWTSAVGGVGWLGGSGGGGGHEKDEQEVGGMHSSKAEGQGW